MCGSRPSTFPSLGRQAGRYAIAVIDNGPGIAPEHLPRLTERFYRVDVASSREKGGTGLGLAIVKHILNRHRGELAITSKPGKGSTFTVMLNEARASHPDGAPTTGCATGCPQDKGLSTAPARFGPFPGLLSNCHTSDIVALLRGANARPAVGGRGSTAAWSCGDHYLHPKGERI